MDGLSVLPACLPEVPWGRGPGLLARTLRAGEQGQAQVHNRLLVGSLYHFLQKELHAQQTRGTRCVLAESRARDLAMGWCRQVVQTPSSH